MAGKKPGVKESWSMSGKKSSPNNREKKEGREKRSTWKKQRLP